MRVDQYEVMIHFTATQLRDLTVNSISPPLVHCGYHSHISSYTPAGRLFTSHIRPTSASSSDPSYIKTLLSCSISHNHSKQLIAVGIMAKRIPNDPGLPPSKYVCLTIFGFKNPKLTEEQYRRHMIEVSAPLTKDLFIKYGIKRWTVTHCQSKTRNLVDSMYDSQMATVAPYDCLSQVVLESIDHYLAMKQDPWYKKYLYGDHEKFAETGKTM